MTANDVRTAIDEALDHADIYQLIDAYNAIVCPETPISADDVTE